MGIIYKLWQALAGCNNFEINAKPLILDSAADINTKTTL